MEVPESEAQEEGEEFGKSITRGLKEPSSSPESLAACDVLGDAVVEGRLRSSPVVGSRLTVAVSGLGCLRSVGESLAGAAEVGGTIVGANFTGPLGLGRQ